MIVTYEASGLVIGELWGGGKGAYQSGKYANSSREEMIKEINKDFESGGLDGGMGFQKLWYAIMEISIHRTILVDGRKFENTEYEIMYLGNPDDSAVGQLHEALAQVQMYSS